MEQMTDTKRGTYVCKPEQLSPEEELAIRTNPRLCDTKEWLARIQGRRDRYRLEDVSISRVAVEIRFLMGVVTSLKGILSDKDRKIKDLMHKVYLLNYNLSKLKEKKLEEGE